MPRATNKAASHQGSKEYTEIKSSMLTLVGGEGATAHDADLIGFYMDLWCQRQMLRDDIHKRGVYIAYDNGGGQKGTKRNDSVQDELKVTSMMLNIRSALNIREPVIENVETPL